MLILDAWKNAHFTHSAKSCLCKAESIRLLPTLNKQTNKQTKFIEMFNTGKRHNQANNLVAHQQNKENKNSSKC